MTPESTLAAAKFLMENTTLSINNVTADYAGKSEIGCWTVSHDDELIGYDAQYYSHAELEQLARLIGWKGDGE